VSDDGVIVLGGTQDNGSVLTKVATAPDVGDTWSLIGNGDGGYAAVDSRNGYLFFETPGADGLKIFRLNSRTGEETFTKFPDPGAFFPPVVMDPQTSSVLWTGGHYVWRTSDSGDHWVRVTPTKTGAVVTAIAVAPQNSDVVYVGYSDGTVWMTSDATARPPTWVQTSPLQNLGPSGPLEVGGIAIAPADPKIVYVTYREFDVGHVFKSTDAGLTWTNIDGSIPNVPVNTVAINPLNPNMVFVGTDVGVLQSLDGGATWGVANDNLATTIVQQLVFQKGTSQLYAFTFGRGAYRVDVGS
jgi:photosystem II stability/assembly factor-like uncharacterized protein